MKKSEAKKRLRELRRQLSAFRKRLVVAERESAVVREALQNTGTSRRALRRIILCYAPQFRVSTAVRGKKITLTIPPGLSLPRQVALYEKAIILGALDSTQGNRSAAARLLKLRPSTFFYMLERHGIGCKGR